MKIHEYLELDTEKELIQCSDCGNELCGARENYREYSAVRAQPVTEAGPRFRDPEEVLGEDPGYEFREFFCPNCGILFGHRFALEDDGFVHDIEIAVDELG
jgi:acetophenone carboxylase